MLPDGNSDVFGFSALSSSDHERSARYRERNSRFSLDSVEEFEDTLAIEKIVKAGTERFGSNSKHHVSTRRRARLRAGSCGTASEPSCDLQCLQTVLQNIDFPRAFLVDADSAFVKLLPELAVIYQAINQYLSSMDLPPDIEAELQVRAPDY